MKPTRNPRTRGPPTHVSMWAKTGTLCSKSVGPHVLGGAPTRVSMWVEKADMRPQRTRPRTGQKGTALHSCGQHAVTKCPLDAGGPGVCKHTSQHQHSCMSMCMRLVCWLVDNDTTQVCVHQGNSIDGCW